VCVNRLKEWKVESEQKVVGGAQSKAAAHHHEAATTHLVLLGL